MPNLLEPYSAKQKGRVVCALEWVPLPVGHEPALFLLASPSAGGKGYIIPRSRLDLYVRADGGEKPALAGVAQLAATRLALGTGMDIITAICDLVQDAAPTLRAMPLAPPKPH